MILLHSACQNHSVTKCYEYTPDSNIYIAAIFGKQVYSDLVMRNYGNQLFHSLRLQFQYVPAKVCIVLLQVADHVCLTL